MNPENLARVLAQHSFCADFTPEVTAFLCGCTKNVRFKSDEFVFREGEPADWMYLIREGRVSLENHFPGRGGLTVETLGSGEVLGWAVLFPPNRWPLDCRALAPTAAFAVDGKCLRNKLDADAAFAYAITRRLLLESHRRLERARLQQLDVYRAELNLPAPSRTAGTPSAEPSLEQKDDA